MLIYLFIPRKKDDLASLKLDADETNVDKWETIPVTLDNLKLM